MKTRNCFISICISFFAGIIVYGQDNADVLGSAKLECIYDYTVTEGEVSDHYMTILQIGAGCSLFKDYSSYQKDSVEMLSGIPEDVVEKYRLQEIRNEFFYDEVIYQNFPKGKLSLFGTIPPDYFTYTEDINTIKWNLTDEIKNVCGYECKKAVCEYGGRIWQVWYSEEIPSSFGPWKFCGLPGLVLSASDVDEKHSFRAIIIRNAGLQTITGPTVKAVRTTREKYIRLKMKFEDDPMGSMPPEAISNMTIRKMDGGKSAIYINGMQFRPRTHKWESIELE